MESTQSKLPDSIFIPLLKSFLESFPTRLTALREAINAEDLEELRKAAHQLNGAASSYGFPAISHVASQLEELAVSNQFNLEEALKLMKTLQVFCDEALFSFANSYS